MAERVQAQSLLHLNCTSTTIKLLSLMWQRLPWQGPLLPCFISHRTIA